MNRIVNTARVFYGICMAAIGFQQFFYSEFRPVIMPPWPSGIPGLVIWVWAASLGLVGAGLAIIFKYRPRKVSLVLGAILLLLFLSCQVPYETFIDPIGNHLALWTNAFKLLALSGGAFVVAGSFPEEISGSQKGYSWLRFLEKAIPLGSIFFAIMLIVFGMDHFLYTKYVALLVPDWIGNKIFWTNFAGVALTGSGVAIILDIRRKQIAMLLGIMLFLWVLVLHIPRAIADPYVDKGNEVTSIFEALGFSGIAFMIAFRDHNTKKDK
jgi:uncharacterized membrane protein YphA (DoxX/SURF4 family)